MSTLPQLLSADLTTPKEGVDRDHAQVYKTAGYPQLKQVQHTAFDITDLSNLDMNAITANDLVWVANKSNKDWDVFRITSARLKIAQLRSSTMPHSWN